MRCRARTTTPLEEYGYMDCQDSDLAAGGLMMIPGSSQIVGGGKMGELYLLKTASLGHERTRRTREQCRQLYVERGIENSRPYPTSCTDKDALGNPIPNGKTWYVKGPTIRTVIPMTGSVSMRYSGPPHAAMDDVSRFTPTSIQRSGRCAAVYLCFTRRLDRHARLHFPQVAQPAPKRPGYPGVHSSNGTNDGILWTIDQGQPIQSPQPTTHATLYAYDATTLSTELYSSDTNPGDQARRSASSSPHPLWPTARCTCLPRA